MELSETKTFLKSEIKECRDEATTLIERLNSLEKAIDKATCMEDIDKLQNSDIGDIERDFKYISLWG